MALGRAWEEEHNGSLCLVNEGVSENGTAIQG